MKTLWEDVTENGYSNIDGLTGLDATTESEISAAITDDPVSMVSYTDECYTGMVACEGVLGKIEGRCAVDYMRATTESAKAEVTATMEGAVRDAWETFKRYIRKAYKAIKEFLQKVWNKIKAKAATIKAMITKYEKVLRDSKVNPSISWATFDFKNLMETRDRLLDQYKAEYNQVKNQNHKDDSYAPGNNGTFTKNVDTNSELKRALWGNEHGPEYNNSAKWSDHKAEAIAVADGSVEKIIQDYMNLGEKSERELMNDLKDAEAEINDKRDDAKQGTVTRNKLTTARTYARVAIMVNQQAAHLLTSGATAYRAQCVAACRKAIQATHGVKEGYTPSTESATNFESIMAQMM